jgi:tetratricopeptide (TPR) repeat protein
VLTTWAAVAARRLPPAAGRVLAGLLLVLLGGLTWSQATVYRDLFALFRDTLEKNPGCWMARNNLGTLWLRRNEFREAEEQFRRCLELKPDHFGARRGLARSLAAQGRAADARTELLVSLDALAGQAGEGLPAGRKESVAQEYVDIGLLFEWMREDAEAERAFRLALAVWPESPPGHFRLGNSLAKRGRFAEAIPHLQGYVQASPESAEAHYFLAQALQAGGFPREAAAAAAEALRLAEVGGDQTLARVILHRFGPSLPLPREPSGNQD